jgi:hypothetical protein
MITVWKQPLRITPFQPITIPEGAEVLHIAEQHGELCIWFRCDTSARPVTRYIAICGTGGACPSDDEGQYLGSVLMLEGGLVWHVFVKVNP